MRDMEQLGINLMGVAIELWHQDGRVVTMSFAVGAKHRVFASPVDAEGEAVGPLARVFIHAMMTGLAEARYIGRVDEAWAQIRDIDDEPPRPGDLARLAETDPSISTVITVEILDRQNKEMIAFMSRLVIDDDGKTSWEMSQHDAPDGRIANDLMTASQLATDHAPFDLSFDVLRDNLEAWHWTMMEVAP